MLDRIKLFQTDRAWAEIREQVWDLVETEHNQGYAQRGPLNEKLEQRLAKQFNRKHCITTANCTDALDISIQSLNLPKKSKIAVGNYTFTASAHSIARAGHLVDVLDVKDNYCVNVDQITDHRALVAVDIFGNMCDIDSLDIPVIVDAAQSLESHNGQAWSASRGLISCISFSPSKTISSWGSGGAILTNDDDIADTCRKLRLHGKLQNDDDSIAPGLNSMMSSMEVAAVWAGLDRSSQWQQRREDIANYLLAETSYKCGLDLDLAQHTFHKLVFQSDNQTMVLEKFKRANIDCVVHYPRLINNETLYQQKNNLTNSEYLRNISFTIPNQHTLTDAEVERIAEVLR